MLVSELAEPELTRTLGELRSYTPATITDRGRLDAELAEVRAKGYAVAADELDLGLTAVAAPVRNAHGEIIASVSVSGPTFRFGAARQAELAPLVRAAADDVSNQLGWRPV